MESVVSVYRKPQGIPVQESELARYHVITKNILIWGCNEKQVCRKVSSVAAPVCRRRCTTQTER